MANALGEDLTGRFVVLKEEVMSPAYRDVAQRILRVDGGFGAAPFTIGTALFGVMPVDGERARWNGLDVERYATDEEIAEVTGGRG